MSSDIDVQVIENTQKILGKHLKKPPLTEKLLRKPPFRFLHDIVTNTVRETGFLKGLYTELELLSENIKEKDEKVIFFTKLIDALKTITGTELNVRPTKIIAGLDPTATNLLLQSIGNALDKKLDSTQYIAQLKAGKRSKSQNNVTEKNKQIKDKSKVKRPEVKSQKLSKSTPRKTASKINEKPESDKSSTRGGKKVNDINTKNKTRNSEDTPVNGVKNINNSNQSILVDQKPNDEVEEVEDKIESNKNTTEAKTADSAENEIETNIKSTNDADKSETTDILNKDTVKIRLKSAKPEFDRTKQNKNEDESSHTQTSTTTNDATSLHNDIYTSVRPKSSLRPPSVRPSSARPGAPRLRTDDALPQGEIIPLGKVNIIVENYNNKDVNEEETVTIQTIYNKPDSQTTLAQLPNDKGYLVEQILEQFEQDNTDDAKPALNIEWKRDAYHNRSSTSKEIEQLKAAIQTLTKTANPLGKLVNYLHEDIDAMHSELDMWINSIRRITADVVYQKRLQDESSKPLQQQLQEIEDNIQKHEQQITAVRTNILRNEMRIREFLIK